MLNPTSSFIFSEEATDGGWRRRAQAAAGGTHRRERRGRLRREEARVWLDLMVVVVCTDLKHWKMLKKKTCERYIGFPVGGSPSPSPKAQPRSAAQH